MVASSATRSARFLVARRLYLASLTAPMISFIGAMISPTHGMRSATLANALTAPRAESTSTAMSAALRLPINSDAAALTAAGSTAGTGTDDEAAAAAAAAEEEEAEAAAA